jgi:hypothetical protein
MHEMWHFEESAEGWRWVRTDLGSGAVTSSTAVFATRTACMVDALGNGYVASRRPYGPYRAAVLH